MDPEYGLEGIENVVNKTRFSLRFTRRTPPLEPTVTPTQPNSTSTGSFPKLSECLESQYKPSKAQLKRLFQDKGHSTQSGEGRSLDSLSNRVNGYPKLAAHIEMWPYSAIYRRFTALNAQNVLYLQAELTELERELQEQQVLDSKDTDGMGSRYALTWFWLKHSADDGDGEQLRIVMRIREVLKEYRDQALIQQSTILNYPDPEIEDVHYLQDLLQSEEMGPLALIGEDATIWGSVMNRKSTRPDLVTSRFRPQKDRFTVWATKQVASLILRIHYIISERFRRLPYHVRNRNEPLEKSAVYRTVYRLTVIVASLIPISSIAVLYYVRSMPARLAIIAAFNVLVSICLMGLANAKWVEVFAITAAFAAVQVVFVATDQSQKI